MTHASAQIELEQYIITLDVKDCPGDRWGHKIAVWSDGSSGHTSYRAALRMQAEDAIAGASVAGYRWEPHYRWDSRIRVSRQLCLYGENVFPSAKDYAASVAWSAKVTDWRERGPQPIRVPPPPKYKPFAGGTGCGADIRAAANDKSFAKLYRSFAPLAAPASVQDLHKSRVSVVRANDGTWELHKSRRRKVAA